MFRAWMIALMSLFVAAAQAQGFRFGKLRTPKWTAAYDIDAKYK